MLLTPVSTLWKCTAQMATSCTNSFQPQRISAATSGEVLSRIAFGLPSKWFVPWPTRSAHTARRCASLPSNPFNDMAEPDAAATYFALIEQLRRLRLAYPHVVEVATVT